MESKKHSIGIMQGRLTPQGDNQIQFFPFNNWQKEFKDAAEIGIDEIEWIFDFDNFENNPLWTENGIKEIKENIKTSGVRINVICADYFMRKPFFRVSEEVKSNSIMMLKKLVEKASLINASVVEIPFLDNSSMKTKDEQDVVIKILNEILPDLKEKNIVINLETDLDSKSFKLFLSKLPNKFFMVTYDSGNSSGLGYNPEAEFESYGDRISHVHIKDRLKGGKTVELGKGDANFEKIFESIGKIGYKGSFILQVARGVDGKEKDTIKNQKDFVRKYIERYLNII